MFSVEDLGRIAALADRYGVIVLADEIHASLTLPGARHIPYVTAGGAAAEHGVTLASASKSFNVAGLKGAVAVAGSPAMEALLGRLPAASQFGAGLLGVLASLAAWDAGGEWLDALIAQLDGRTGGTGGAGVIPTDSTVAQSDISGTISGNITASLDQAALDSWLACFRTRLPRGGAD